MDLLLNFALPAFVGGGSAWAIVHFLGERMLTHRLSKDLQRHKAELSERTDVLKTQLSIFAHEQNVTSSRVDSQRSKAIHNIYACVREVVNPVSSIGSGSPIVGGTAKQSMDFYYEHAEEAHAACGTLVHTMADLAIYFDNETYIMIADFAHTSMNAIGFYLSPLRENIAKGIRPEDLLGLAERGRMPLKKEFDEVMLRQAKRLTEVFRIQLGIEMPNKTFKSDAEKASTI